MQDIFDLSKTFADLGLRDALLEGITAKGYRHPTLIQAELIPLALQGRDVLGQAKTGSGKTAAFALPLLQLLNPEDAFSALILVPTRELAVQVAAEIKELAHFAKIDIAAIYGGQPIRKQIPKLEARPSIIVGTPGRVMDLHERRLIPYENVRFAILDEVDRMLDIGFRDDIRKILTALRKGPQTIFVSATISPEIERLARTYMKDPAKIVSTQKSLTVSNVHQTYLPVEPWDKRRLLLHLLTHEEPALTIVFCRMKRTVDEVTEYLNDKKIDAFAMHGDMYQTKRDQVMARLREGNLKVLVASDLASRGLDVDDISHVINYDLPEDPEIYVHRIGRTARAGRAGVAWAFVCPDQGQLLSNIEQLANVEILKKEYSDFKPGPVPNSVIQRREAEVKRREEQATTRNRHTPTTPQEHMKNVDSSAFPDGMIPIAMPERRMGGRVKTKRSR
ncbi:MAG: DEAD/DEAH box helicase [Phycisphaerae bacterium]|nr:DEAD/DEAH box helicase [Phycisphaerae bacterium]